MLSTKAVDYTEQLQNGLVLTFLNRVLFSPAFCSFRQGTQAMLLVYKWKVDVREKKDIANKITITALYIIHCTTNHHQYSIIIR